MTYLLGEALINLPATLAMGVGYSFLGKPLRANLLKYTLFVAITWAWSTLVVAIDSVVSLGMYIPFLIYLMIILLYLVIFKETMIKSIVCFAFAMIPGFLFEGILVLSALGIFKLSFEEISAIYWLRFFLSSLTVAFQLLVKLIVPFKKMLYPLEKQLKVLAFMFGNITLFLVFSKPVMVGRADTFMSIISLLPLFAFAMVLNYMIAISLINDTRQAQKLQNYQNQKFTLGSVVKSDFRLRDQFLKDLEILEKSVDETNNSGMSDYIKTVKEEISQLNTYQSWANPLLAVMVNEYEKKANANGIVFNATPNLTENTYDIEEYELIEIIKDLLDISFGGSDDWDFVQSVELNIKSEDKLIMTLASERVSKKGYEKNDGYFNKKAFTHVKKIIEKYNGTMTIDKTDNNHIVQIAI